VAGWLDQVEWSSGWPESRQRAIQPVGITVTVMRRPHRGQKRGGSKARPHPAHSVDGLPQPVQCVVTVRGSTEWVRWRR
jgi:hypothetical protein